MPLQVGNQLADLVIANTNQDDRQRKCGMLGIVSTMNVDECAEAVTKIASSMSGNLSQNPILSLLHGAVLHPKNRDVLEKIALKIGFTVAFVKK
jgi:hypothetical protein